MFNNLWTEQQSEQMRTPRLTEAQDGFELPQSAQSDSGCRDFDLENMIMSF